MTDFVDRLTDGKDRPLDAGVIAGNRGLQEVSRGLGEAADNLLRKALRAIEAGDEERARRLVDRACRLPWDEHEECYPAPWSAQMMLYTSVGDALEEAGEGESDWLDAALEILPELSEVGREHLATTLFGFVRQDAVFHLAPAEQKRIRAATGIRPIDLDDLPEETPHEELVAMTRALLDAVRRLRAGVRAAAHRGLTSCRRSTGMLRASPPGVIAVVTPVVPPGTIPIAAGRLARAASRRRHLLGRLSTRLWIRHDAEAVVCGGLDA